MLTITFLPKLKHVLLFAGLFCNIMITTNRHLIDYSLFTMLLLLRRTEFWGHFATIFTLQYNTERNDCNFLHYFLDLSAQLNNHFRQQIFQFALYFDPLLSVLARIILAINTRKTCLHQFVCLAIKCYMLSITRVTRIRRYRHNVGLHHSVCSLQ